MEIPNPIMTDGEADMATLEDIMDNYDVFKRYFESLNEGESDEI